MIAQTRRRASIGPCAQNAEPRLECAGRSEVPVNFATMSDGQKVDDSLSRIEGVDHAVITNTKTVTIAAG